MKVTVGPDPSLVYRPDVDPEVAKDKASFRNYTSGPLLDRVFTTYKLMHTHQTVDFVRSKHAQFGGFSYKKMTVMEAVDLLDGLVDESDPDVDFPNSFHAFQTAEGIRKAHPDKVPNLPCPSPSQTGSTSSGSCTTWGRSWPCSGSPSGRSSATPSPTSPTAPHGCLSLLSLLSLPSLPSLLSLPSLPSLLSLCSGQSSATSSPTPPMAARPSCPSAVGSHR
ncbi:inositol oxygenase isoform X2 [Homo sapiens]|uniref:inositol oxygenase isoform X2 n=1 Tax=Homo sapiens TaxID=9606 RepID=UPI0005D037A8|nr:inositol oxygenase isoform X2 [Homo sapiens]XP_054181763.1 inositol oxygenase isoform X2 [Homo sapiens]|eukprot:XP_011529007.1 inositol oxygenase isoform X2 [Homo sapiens]